jgi:hypothetical protein
MVMGKGSMGQWEAETMSAGLPGKALLLCTGQCVLFILFYVAFARTLRETAFGRLLYYFFRSLYQLKHKSNRVCMCFVVRFQEGQVEAR